MREITHIFIFTALFHAFSFFYFEQVVHIQLKDNNLF